MYRFSGQGRAPLCRMLVAAAAISVSVFPAYAQIPVVPNESVLYSFQSPDPVVSPANATLVLASDGNFYGTTFFGGDNDSGSVYRITSSGVYTLLFSFDAVDPFSGTNVAGQNPGQLVVATDGYLYGVASGGGAFGEGTVFCVDVASGDVTVTHAFDFSDGLAFPRSLTAGSDGNLYGIADLGLFGTGGIFKLTSGGTLSTIYSFSPFEAHGANSDGSSPGYLIQGQDGNLYGTSYFGGSGGSGSVFKVTTDGSFTELYAFSADTNRRHANTDGLYPSAALVEAADGSLWGTTSAGGYASVGTVFKIAADGSFSTVFTFNPLMRRNYNLSGKNPQSALVIGKDGGLFGTTYFGGHYGSGTTYEILPTGSFRLIHSFGANTTDGQFPGPGMILGNDGGLYGTTMTGGLAGAGVFYRIDVAPAANGP